MFLSSGQARWRGGYARVEGAGEGDEARNGPLSAAISQDQRVNYTPATRLYNDKEARQGD